MPDIIGIDIPCMDLLINIDHLPQPNESFPMREMSWQGGGKVASALTAAARLGASSGIIGVVGADAFGDFCRKDFERHGIDTRYLFQQKDIRTPFSLVLSDLQTGGRNIIWDQGTFPNLDFKDLDPGYLAQSKYIHLANSGPCNLDIARWARANQIKVSYDADHFGENIEQILPNINVFIASEFLHSEMFGNSDYEANCRSILKEGPEIVVFTLGGRGCVGMWGTQFFMEPAFQIQVVDTVGAGDVFHGAYLYSLLQGWEPDDAARFSNAVAAIKCTRIGGRAGVPTAGTTIEFMKTGVIDFTEIDKRVSFYDKSPF